MYYFLTGAVCDRMVEELQRYWRYHPKYTDLPGNIQGKYAWETRPQRGIVVKVGSASRVDLSADNYIGAVRSYVYLTRVQGFNGTAIEWVREDSRAIQENRGIFPSLPGVYYITLTGDYEFVVEPMLDVVNEPAMLLSPTEAQLQRGFIEGTLALYEMPSGFLLQQGFHYTVDATTGTITLARPLSAGQSLLADYRYAGVSTGPWNFQENTGVNKAIPGCVLAFGRRNKAGDRMAVVVQQTRELAALEYGGKWDLQVELDIMARDVFDQREMADQSTMYLLAMARSRLSNEGLEMTDISMGGESEEQADETGDDYFFNSTISLTIQTEWKIYVPLVLTLRSATPMTQEQVEQAASLDDDQIVNFENNIKTMQSLGLDLIRDPYFVDKSRYMETIV